MSTTTRMHFHTRVHDTATCVGTLPVHTHPPNPPPPPAGSQPRVRRSRQPRHQRALHPRRRTPGVAGREGHRRLPMAGAGGALPGAALRPSPCRPPHPQNQTPGPKGRRPPPPKNPFHCDNKTLYQGPASLLLPLPVSPGRRWPLGCRKFRSFRPEGFELSSKLPSRFPEVPEVVTELAEDLPEFNEALPEKPELRPSSPNWSEDFRGHSESFRSRSESFRSRSGGSRTGRAGAEAAGTGGNEARPESGPGVTRPRERPWQPTCTASAVSGGRGGLGAGGGGRGVGGGRAGKGGREGNGGVLWGKWG